MGRPLQTTVSDTERHDIETRASKKGLTVSNYIREALGLPALRQGRRKLFKFDMALNTGEQFDPLEGYVQASEFNKTGTQRSDSLPSVERATTERKETEAQPSRPASTTRGAPRRPRFQPPSDNGSGNGTRELTIEPAYD